jgi:hypothetical protein
MSIRWTQFQTLCEELAESRRRVALAVSDIDKVIEESEKTVAKSRDLIARAESALRRR